MSEAKNRHDEYFEKHFQKILNEYNKKFKDKVEYKSNAGLLKESFEGFGSEKPESFIYISTKSVSLLFPESFKNIKKFVFNKDKNKFMVGKETYDIKTLEKYCIVRNEFLKIRSNFKDLAEFIKYIEDELEKKYEKSTFLPIYLRLVILEASYYNERHFEGKLKINLPDEEKEALTQIKSDTENVEKAVVELIYEKLHPKKLKKK